MIINFTLIILAFVILRAEESCNDDTGTHGNAVKETHKHVDDTSGRTDRGQSSTADKFAHNPGIKRMIELLKNIAQKNRQGEQKHLFPDGAFRQCIAIVMQEDPFFQKLQ